METKADIYAMTLAYKTGYNPQGLVQVLERGKQLKGSFPMWRGLQARIDKCKTKIESLENVASLTSADQRFARFQKQL